jgi:putative transposase
MPRGRRLVPVDGAMHIMCRGNNKQIIFFRDRDKEYYYSLLDKFKEENDINIIHYCLMNNHVHLIVWLNHQSQLSRFMKQVNLSYFKHFSRNYDYCGHFWQNRFKSTIIDTDSYLLQCGKYIELNPVRANIVSFAEEYTYSSYNYYAKGNYDSILTPNPIFMEFSTSEASRRKHYIDFIVDSSLVNDEKLMTHLFIGCDQFIKKMEETYKVRNLKAKRGRPKNKRENK